MCGRIRTHLNVLTIHVKLQGNMLKKIIGPSPAGFVIKKVGSSLFCRGGDGNAVLPPTQEFILPDEGPCETKIPRMSQLDLNKLLQNKSKRGLTKDEKLLVSVIEHAELTRSISKNDFKNLEEWYTFLQKYKNYLRLKRMIPYGLVAPLTGTELSKMAYATAIGSKSVSLTIPGIIGYSLPAFFFFHMSYYYAPDKFKKFCSVGKFTFGLSFVIVNYLVDEITQPVEERLFGEGVPIDINKTGGSIPSDIGNLDEILSLLKDFKSAGADLMKKSY